MPKETTTPTKVDPGAALASLTESLSKIGGVDGALGKMDESEARSKLINYKLTILLEHFNIDWKADGRIQKLKK